VPQGAFVDVGATVGWHLRYLLDHDVTTAEVESALDRVALSNVLRAHATKQRRDPLDVLAGELSGGERQRMHLARVILQSPELVVMDEPEVSLDDAGRALLRDLITELTISGRVLLIAHDEQVIPQGFSRLRLTRGVASVQDSSVLEARSARTQADA
jgi:ABC-type Mn2+/Zn2+ transport system ATPase subunit